MRYLPQRSIARDLGLEIRLRTGLRQPSGAGAAPKRAKSVAGFACWVIFELVMFRSCYSTGSAMQAQANRSPVKMSSWVIKMAFRCGAVAWPLWLLSAGWPARATVVVGIGQNFTASTLGVDSSALPPDSNGAVGPAHFVELINGRFAVFDKATGSPVQSFTDVTFWSRAGVTIPARWAVTDPRLVYDPVSQRWFAVQIDFDTLGMINSNHFLLAISSTADPAGTWTGMAITADPTLSTTADFPTLGVDSNGVYLAGSMFDTGGNLVSSALISIPKTNLLAANPSVAGMTRFANLSLAERGIILQPAVALDGSGGANILSTASLGVDLTTGNFVTNTTLVTFAVQNAADQNGATLGSSSVLTVPEYTAPLDPPQPDGTTNLADGDARFSAAVYRVGAVLYAVHNTEVDGRAALRWYRIAADTSAVLESGTISDPVLDLFYPSIAANTNGTAIIACNGTSSTNFVSCYATVGETVNGVTTFGGLVLLKAGAASYQDGSGVESRWGDYSTTTVDAADPSSFWTIQMYPAGPTTWATQVTQLRTAEVRLSIAPAGTNVLLSWTSLAGGAQLQSKGSLSGSGSWASLPQAPTTNGNLISVLVPVSAQPRFFRLKL